MCGGIIVGYVWYTSGIFSENLCGRFAKSHTDYQFPQTFLPLSNAPVSTDVSQSPMYRDFTVDFGNEVL